MRRLCILIMVLLVPVMARAYTVDQMLQEFDARLLTDQEKRFLQTGLAFANVYNGLIDGAWGPGSQRALERFSRANGDSEIVTNTDVLFLAVEAYSALEAEGWERQYNAGLDMSFLVPTASLADGAPSEVFLNLTVRGRSIGYSLAIAPATRTAGFHDYTASQAVGEVYSVRRPKLWITSARTRGGLSLYTRSDLRHGTWSTIIVSARDQDAGAYAAITGSIAPGYAPAIGISTGLLSAGIATLSEILDATEEPPAPAARATPLPEAGSGAARAGTEGAAPGYGTGFVVTAAGHVLTNRHVVAGCAALVVDGKPARLLAEDSVFDLALLQVGELAGAVPAVFAAEPARLNSDVTVAGYPLPDLLGGLNVTRGAVTSLKGIGGDGINMQISAPVQPGNSGGPVVNAAGQVVGVVVAKLDVAYAMKRYEDIPQNVNFAIRGEIAKLFLAQNGVDPLVAPVGDAVAPEVIAEWAGAFTRLVGCQI